MRVISAAICAGLLAASLFSATPACATTVKHVDLGHMTAASARVFRGTVVDVRAGSKRVGGGEIATTIYRIKVSEAFKGEFATFKNVTYADVEMLGDIKAHAPGSGPRRFAVFRDMPRLERDHDYLLFLTAESSIALSSPVGLAQGLFDIDTTLPAQPTANRMNNAGLAADIKQGAVPYAQLAARVRALVSEQGRTQR